MDPQAQVTLLLRDAKNGQAEALQLLIPIVYDELRRWRHYLRDERAADTCTDSGPRGDNALVARPPGMGMLAHFMASPRTCEADIVDHAGGIAAKRAEGGDRAARECSVRARQEDTCSPWRRAHSLAAVDERSAASSRCLFRRLNATKRSGRSDVPRHDRAEQRLARVAASRAVAAAP